MIAGKTASVIIQFAGVSGTETDWPLISDNHTDVGTLGAHSLAGISLLGLRLSRGVVNFQVCRLVCLKYLEVSI